MENRIFANRGLQLDKIKFVGFDMDYTLAMYKSPDFEILAFRILVQNLIKAGYPEDLKSYEYDASFAVRGLWFDRLYGNLLKVDSHGYVLVCVHGFKFLNSTEIEKLYPNKFVKHSQRFSLLNSLFGLPETFTLAIVVDYMESHSSSAMKGKDGVAFQGTEMTFSGIAKDIRDAFIQIHVQGELQSRTLENIEKYVIKDDRIPALLAELKRRGIKTFLLTNSRFEYTNAVMSYLFSSDAQSWRTCFDTVIVEAKKPSWFSEGSVFRQANVENGQLHIESDPAQLHQEHVYAGGSCEEFTKLIGARGRDVLYIGDHMYGDILKCKKAGGWRTFLIVPELHSELSVWKEHKPLFDRLVQLENELANVFREMHHDEEGEQKRIVALKEALKKQSHELDQKYGILGSFFRVGSRLTFFASQVERYADLYSSSCCNLLNYPKLFYFRAPSMLLPHEHDGHIPNMDQEDQLCASHKTTELLSSTHGEKSMF